MKTKDEYVALFCKIMAGVFLFVFLFFAIGLCIVGASESGRRYKIEYLSPNGGVERVEYSRKVWHQYGTVNYVDENKNLVSTSETVRIVNLN